jgi:glycosyltransferase involved in cell wall biosynthesis
VKLLLVADAVGGVFTHAVELARALGGAGVRVVLATEGAELTPDRRRLVMGLPAAVHEGRAFRLEWMEEPWADVAAAGEWLLALEARERPDVVHTCEYAHGALPFRGPVLVAAHSCVLSWYEAVRGEPAPPSWDRYRAAVAAGLRGAGAVVAPTAWMARAAVRHHGPLALPHVVPNGRDPSRFRPGVKDPLVMAAGRVWDEAKNVAALVRVAPRIPWTIAIAGDPGPGPGPGPRPSSDAGPPGPGPRPGPGQGPGLRGSPIFLGRLPEAELSRWLSRAAIFAHPARYEPFGLAVLEAALAGCALVLGDLESLRETWDGAAAFVPPEDDDAIAAALAELAADPARRGALAARARARALDLGPARMAAGYLALYRALLAGGAREVRP